MITTIIEILKSFGIAETEYIVSALPWGEMTFTAAGHTVTVLPDTGRFCVQIDKGWTLDRLGSDNVPLVAATALTAILRKGAVTVEDEEFRRVLLSNATVSSMFFAGKNLNDVVIELVRQLDAAKAEIMSLKFSFPL
jgi:hypothetical protein